MIRVLFIGLVLLINGIAPAFAEMVYLACGTSTTNVIFDTDAKTVEFTFYASNPYASGPHPMQITDSQVTWHFRAGTFPEYIQEGIYDRNAAQLHLWIPNYVVNNTPEPGVDQGIVTCVRGQKPPPRPPRPF
jgi:hypothetical protein